MLKPPVGSLGNLPGQLAQLFLWSMDNFDKKMAAEERYEQVGKKSSLPPQSGAHRRGAFRGSTHTHPSHPIHPTYSFRAFEPFYGDLKQPKQTKADQSTPRQTKADQGKQVDES